MIDDEILIDGPVEGEKKLIASLESDMTLNRSLREEADVDKPFDAMSWSVRKVWFGLLTPAVLPDAVTLVRFPYRS